MRGLIRPASFWVARIGLMLSVVLWIVSQYTVMFCTIPFGREFGFQSSPSGCITRVIDSKGEFKFQRIAVKDLNIDPEPYFVRRETDPFLAHTIFVLDIPGVLVEVMSRGIGPGWSRVASRHWFNVTVFALFYAVLKWVYRKPEVSDE